MRFICRDNPYVVHLKRRDCTNVVHFKCPYQLVLPQWPPQPCRQRAQRRRGPKIVNISRTEGCRSPSELVLPQWPPRPCRQRVQRRRGPKIINFARVLLAIRSSLARSCDLARRRARSPNFDQSEARKLSHTTDTHTANRHAGRPCSTSSAFKNKRLLLFMKL